MNLPLVLVAVRFVLLSLVAVGGANSVISVVRAQLVGSGAIDEATFARLYAVSQFAPGPNVMYVPLVGWTLGGAAAAFVDLCAFVIPPAILAVVVDRALRRRTNTPFIRSLRRVFRLLAGTVLTASGVALIVTSAHGSIVLFGIAIATLVIVLRTNLNVLWCLAASAIAGAVMR